MKEIIQLFDSLEIDFPRNRLSSEGSIQLGTFEDEPSLYYGFSIFDFF